METAPQINRNINVYLSKRQQITSVQSEVNAGPEQSTPAESPADAINNAISASAFSFFTRNLMVKWW